MIKCVTGALFLLLLMVIGCSQTSIDMNIDEKELVKQARTILIAYSTDQSPLLRAHAIEGLADSGQESAVRFILEGLNDPYWGVRFTSCMAILDLRYAPAKSQLQKMLSDQDSSVQAGAIGALHVLGDNRFTSRLGRTLFDKNVIVRRNTALVLGRMGDKEGIKLLRSSFRDNDLSVRLQALEALVLLDDPKAKRLMTNYTRSAFDDECILAMMSLARAKVQDAKEQIRYIFDKNNSSDRLGMRLIAARAMALLGDDTGKKDALSALTFKATRVGQPAAIRQLAAAALGEMKDPMTLPYLKQTLNDEDPDVRIASVTAILKINQSQLPF